MEIIALNLEGFAQPQRTACVLQFHYANQYCRGISMTADSLSITQVLIKPDVTASGLSPGELFCPIFTAPNHFIMFREWARQFYDAFDPQILIRRIQLDAAVP